MSDHDHEIREAVDHYQARHRDEGFTGRSGAINRAAAERDLIRVVDGQYNDWLKRHDGDGK